jgi:flagellar biosynthesis protein FlhA
VTAYFVKKKLDDADPEQDGIANQGNPNALSGNASQANAASPQGGAPQVGDEASALTPMESAIEQEVFGLEMGYGLLVLADKKKGGDLLDRITGARTNFAREMGMLLPTIGVRDNIELEPNEYRFFASWKGNYPLQCDT